jgi:DNA-binding MarR family transcriptional regulator
MMKIEEEIKQKRFRNEYQKVTINLLFSSSWVLKRHKDFFSRFRITEQQFNVLRILKGQYPNAISTSDIKRRMLDMNSDSSRIVDRLALKELVTKTICKNDKRLVDVSISENGLDLLRQIDRYSEELDRVVSNLTIEEARNLNDLLDKMRS